MYIYHVKYISYYATFHTCSPNELCELYGPWRRRSPAGHGAPARHSKQEKVVRAQLFCRVWAMSHAHHANGVGPRRALGWAWAMSVDSGSWAWAVGHGPWAMG